MQVDPLATMYATQSGYHYSFNNPVMFNDPSGAYGEGYYGDGGYYYGNGYGSGQFDHGFGGPPSSGSTIDNQYAQAMSGNNYAAREMLRQELESHRASGHNKAEVNGVLYELWEYEGGTIVNGEKIPDEHTYFWKKAEGEQGGMPTVSEFTEFANFFFGQEAGMVKQKAPLNWQIGGDLGHYAGRTTKLKDGSILIEISKKALSDPKLLYLTIGHVLIHAADLANGNYKKWADLVSADGWTGVDRDYLLHAIMEHHAYMWDAATEIKFGTDYGAPRMLEFTTYTLEPWGYLSLFNQ